MITAWRPAALLMITAWRPAALLMITAWRLRRYSAAAVFGHSVPEIS
ncbi:hypothetical protein [Catenuloplanes japonicus]|nr:hypothetical protein [Catenuloplanes japonicus]